VVLAHESPEREIPLFESRAGVGVKELQTETWRRLGTVLERPLLEQNAEGVFAIDAESFDAPLREKLRAEDAATPATVSDLGGRVVVTCDGNATVFASRRFRNCWKGALGLAITLAMLAVGRHIEATEPNAEGIGIFVWMMYGFVAMFVLAFVTELLGREYPALTGSRPGRGHRRDRLRRLPQSTPPGRRRVRHRAPPQARNRGAGAPGGRLGATRGALGAGGELS
jgi:hypothetical protein